MTRNPDATVYVYRHRETGTITALYSDAALDMLHQSNHEHVATLEPRMWIEHHFDDAIKEREACATIDVTPLNILASDGPGTAILKYRAAIRARGNQ